MSAKRSSGYFIVSSFAIIAILVLSVAAESSWSGSFFGSIQEFFGAASSSSNPKNVPDDLVSVFNGPIIFQRGFAAAIDFPYSRGGQLFKVDPVTRTETFFIDGSQPNYSPDGSRLVFTINAQLATMPAVNPVPSPTPNLLVIGGGSRLLGFYPKWSPDGANLSYNTGTTVNGTPAYHVKVISGNCTVCDTTIQTHELNPTGTTNYLYPSWNPRPVAPVTAQLVFVRTSAARSDVDQGNYNGDIFSEAITIASDGTITEGNRVPLTNSPAEYAFPTYSHDGTKIAFINFATTAGNNTLNVMNANGSGSTAIVTFPNSGNRYAHHPVWSPTDDSIAFSDSNQIFQVNVTTGQVSQVSNTAASANDLFPSWAPGTGSPTPTPTPSQFNATLSFDGRFRDRVGKSDSGIPIDGESDGTFSLTLPAATSTKFIESVDLLGPNGNEWDTIPQSSNIKWVVGISDTLDGVLFNSSNGSIPHLAYTVGNPGTFKLFVPDSTPTSFSSGKSFTVTVKFSDGSTATASTTINITAADVAIAFSPAAPASVAYGDTASFSLNITNNGPEVAHGVVLNGSVDSKFKIVGAINGIGCSSAGNSITCNIGDVENGSNRSVRFTATGAQAGRATNLMLVAIDGTRTFETNNANNSVSADTIIGGPTYELKGLEVTQAIQDLNNSVPLMAGKRTIVRAHVSATTAGSSGAFATATLTGTNSADGISRTIAVPDNNRGRIKVLQSPDRFEPDDSFYFNLPAEWTAAGTLQFRFESSSDFICREPDGTPNCATQVTFQNVPAITMQLHRIAFTANGNTYQPTTTDRDNAVNLLKVLFPTSSISSVSYGTRLATLTGVPGTGSPVKTAIDDFDKKILKPLDQFRAIDCRTGSCPQFYMGLLVNPSSTRQAIGGLSNTPGNASGAFVDQNNIPQAQELGHSYGLQHVDYVTQRCPPAPATCTGKEPLPLDAHIPTDGTLSTTKGMYEPTTIFGLDVNSLIVYGPNTPDFMSYAGGPPWVSPATYSRILNILKPPTSPQTPEPESVQAEMVALVSGAIPDPEDGSPEISPVYAFNSPGALNLPPAGTYAIRVENSQGQILGTYSFEPRNTGGESTRRGFYLLLPWSTDISRLVLLHNGQPIASKQGTNNAPVLNVISPNGGESLTGTSATLRWSASDLDGDALSYMVQYSTDAGATWQTIVADLTTTTYDLALNSIPGSSRAMIRVVATDGLRSSQAQSAAIFTVAKRGPDVSVQTPDNNHLYVGDQTIIFTADGFDLEDGQLPDAAFTWSSNLNGSLGTGRSFSIKASTLQEATHVITLSARDSDNQVTTKTVSIRVFRERPVLPATLSIGSANLYMQANRGSLLTSPQTIGIRNAGDGDMTWSATADQPWIQLASATGLAPSDLGVVINPAGLAFGVYSGKITITAPGAANNPQVVNVNLTIVQGPPATVDGRVLTSDGRGLRNATVSITDSLGVVRTATTSSFGFFSFPNVAVGDTYTIRVLSRLYRFATRTLQINDNLTLPDFVGLE